MSQTRYSPFVDNLIEKSSDSIFELEDRNDNCGVNERADDEPYGEGYQSAKMEDSK